MHVQTVLDAFDSSAYAWIASFVALRSVDQIADPMN